MEYERGRKEGVPSNVGPKPTFTGNAMQDALLDDGDKGQVRVYSVVFEPGARTYWHSHAAGQTLLIASGRGMVQNRDGDRRIVGAGNVVWAPPGEVHWHGAAPDSFLSHTAVSLGLTSWARGSRRGALQKRVRRPVMAAAAPGPRSGAREVLAVRYGRRVTSRAESYLNFHLYGEPDAPLDIDYFFWVIREPGRRGHPGRHRVRSRDRRPAPPRPLDHARRRAARSWHRAG